MSDEIDEEYIAQRKARDARIAILETKVAVEDELRSSVIINAVLERAGIEAHNALEALAMVEPANVEKIIELQAIVYRARFIGATINDLLIKGEAAEQSLNEDSRTD